MGLVSFGPHLLEDVVQVHQLGSDHQARLARHLLRLGGDDALPAGSGRRRPCAAVRAVWCACSRAGVRLACVRCTQRASSVRAVHLPAEREAPFMKEGLSEAEVLERQEGHLDGEYVGAVSDECGDYRDGGVTQHVLVALPLYEPCAKVLLSGAHTATGKLAAGRCLQSTGTTLRLAGTRGGTGSMPRHWAVDCWA